MMLSLKHHRHLSYTRAFTASTKTSREIPRNPRHPWFRQENGYKKIKKVLNHRHLSYTRAFTASRDPAVKSVKSASSAVQTRNRDSGKETMDDTEIRGWVFCV